jgi:hypothetical protein
VLFFYISKLSKKLIFKTQLRNSDGRKLRLILCINKMFSRDPEESDIWITFTNLVMTVYQPENEKCRKNTEATEAFRRVRGGFIIAP